MKTTPELLKQRRKERRANSRAKAFEAWVTVIDELGMSGLVNREMPRQVTPSVRMSDTSSLAALMRLKRRLRPLFIQAQDELERRYWDETDRRQKMTRRAIKAAVKEHGADANAFLKSHHYNAVTDTWEERI